MAINAFLAAMATGEAPQPVQIPTNATSNNDDQDAEIPEYRGGCKVLHPNNKCHACSKKPKSLHRCSKCNWALYCNAVCQKAHWKAHKLECKELSKDPAEIRSKGGSGLVFAHAREMIEMITRAGWRNEVKNMEVMQGVSRTTGKTESWIFEASLENENYHGYVFQCKNDA